MSLPPVRAPRYLGRFQCIGSACEDHCCGGWGGIDVDPPTAEAYRQLIADGDRRVVELRMAETLQPNPEAWPDEGWPAALIPLETGASCPFLSAEHLCRVQGLLGEGLLSSTCDTFPRQATLLDGQIDLAGRLSCPEIARLALLADDAMLLETAPADRRLSERGRFWIDRPWTDQPAEDDPRRHYHLVRARTMALVQRRDVSFGARMLTLGLALGTLDGTGFRAAEVEGTFVQAEGQLAAVAAWLDESGLGTPDGPAGPHRLLLRRLRRWIAMPELPGRLRRCVDRVKVGLGLPADPSTPLEGPLGERVSAAYGRAVSRHLGPYLAGRPFLLENLTLNQVWLGTFPYHPERSFADEHAILAFRIGLMRLMLAGAAAAEGGLTDALVVETVQAFDKYVDGHQFWDRTIKMLRGEHAQDPPSIAALLLA
ncbi:MAG: flagellin lysine-N-methylase [Chloroflexi bacterium]|nr:flagellin lysine-N-methylase [Chloroflexota bacterium]